MHLASMLRPKTIGPITLPAGSGTTSSPDARPRRLPLAPRAAKQLARLAPSLQRLRLQWFLARQALAFGPLFLETSYGIYLNHRKVIHYRRGYPVYSLSTPAVFSGPWANFLARQMYAGLQRRSLPNMLNFAVTDGCNAHCEHCSFFSAVDDPDRRVLSTGEAARAIADAQELGVSVLNFVGGEPLLREDLPDLIRSVRKDLTATVVFTNGALLAQRAPDLERAGLDGVYVSLDAADPAAHDRFRGTPGLFRQALAGIEQALAHGFSVGISCTMTPEAVARGELDRLIELGRRMGVHEVLVFDAMPTGRYRWRTDLVDNQTWIEEMIRSVAPYNADPSYPGVLIWAYTAGYRSVGCSCGTNFFYLSPYGDVMPCDFDHTGFGNVLETPLWEIWNRLTSREEYAQSKWGGCKVKDSAYLDRERSAP